MNLADCDLGFLAEQKRAALTGFSSRAFRALGHLREAWCMADDGNARAIEAALRELMRGHSFEKHRDLVTEILVEGLASDQAQVSLAAIGLDRRVRR